MKSFDFIAFANFLDTFSLWIQDPRSIYENFGENPISMVLIKPDFTHHDLAITTGIEWEEIMIMYGSMKLSWVSLC